MLKTKDVALAAETLRQGGVIAYPTEGVWGLGCHPFRQEAVEKILRIKGRDVAKGLILLVTKAQMLNGLVEDVAAVTEKISERERALRLTGPVTWLLPAISTVPRYLKGDHDRLAVRFTKHKLARSLVDSFGLPLVSTSANLSGQPAVTRRAQLANVVVSQIDLLLAGRVGNLRKPTPIYDLVSGAKIRD